MVGRGPGVGPIGVAQHLVPFLPGHCAGFHRERSGHLVRFRLQPWGSASILPISMDVYSNDGRCRAKTSQ